MEVDWKLEGHDNMNMKRIEPTKELLIELRNAQAKHTAELLTDPHNRFADDWGDDTNAALILMRVLFDFTWDEYDLEGFDKWINTPYDENADDLEITPNTHIVTLAHAGGCDGYCQELYDLDCPAMPKEED